MFSLFEGNLEDHYPWGRPERQSRSWWWEFVDVVAVVHDRVGQTVRRLFFGAMVGCVYAYFTHDSYWINAFVGAIGNLGIVTLLDRVYDRFYWGRWSW